MQVTSLSATKIEQYTNCPYAYKLKYIDKAKDKIFRSAGMLTGNTAHKSIEDINKWVVANSGSMEEEELKKALWIKARKIAADRFTSMMSSSKNANYTDFMRKAITPYLTWFIRNSIYKYPLEIEKKYNVTIGELADVMGTGGLHVNWEKYKDVVLTGKPDLVINNTTIVDYKVQKIASFGKSFVSNPQVMLYSMVRGGDLEFVYLFLQDRCIEKHVAISAESRVDKFNKVIGILDNISNTEVFHANTRSCKNCIFKQVCTKVNTKAEVRWK